MARGAYATAAQDFQRALTLRVAAGGSNSAGVAECLNNIALMHLHQGRFDAAIPPLQQALALRDASTNADARLLANTLNNLASAYGRLGRYAQAEPLFLRALALREQTSTGATMQVAESLNNLASVYHVQGKYAEAQPLYARTLDILQQCLGTNHALVGAALNNLGTVCRYQQQWAAAEAYYTRALAVRQVALGTHPDTAQSLDNLARLYAATGRLSNAAPLLAAALDMRRQSLGATHPDVAESLMSMADVADQQGAVSNATALYLDALALRMRMLGTNHADTCVTRATLSRHFARHGAYDAAAAHAWAALLAIEDAARAAGGESYSLSFRQQQRAMCGTLLDDIAALRSVTNATADTWSSNVFTAMEIARARVFLDQLAAVSAVELAGIPPADAADLAAAQHDLEYAAREKSALLRKPAGAYPPEQLGALELRLSQLNARRTAREQALCRRYPRYALLRAPSLVDLDALRTTVLASNELMLCFWEGSNALHACVISRDAYRLVTHPVPYVTRKRAILAYLAALQEEQSLAQFVQASHALYQLVLQPFLPDATALSNCAALYIVPHGMLHTIAFDALLTSTNGASWAALDYVAHRVPVAYVPSATVLAMIRKDLLAGRFSATNRAPAVLFGDPVYPAGDPLREPLPGTRDEVMAISQILYGAPTNQHTFLGPRCSETMVHDLNRRGLLRNARTLHFAVHGFLPGDAPDIHEPCLALASPDAGADDGLLTLSEIITLDLDADVVTLSACDSGFIGAAERAEGVSGLARAFFYAGTARMIVSLWSSDDDASIALMRAFYANLAAGDSAAQAMRKAKTAMLHTPFCHPGLWAGFAIAGEQR
jgi:CHAT domain-containing protein